MKRPRLRKVAGWSLVVFGFLALVTPLTPGGILFFLGLELLGLRETFMHSFRRLTRQTKKVPVLVETSEHTS